MDLPKFDESKKLTCPGSTTIKDVVIFAHGKVKFDNHIVSSGTFDPLKYIDITLPIIYLGAQGEEAKVDFISFPQSQTLGTIYNLLWPLSNMPLCDSRDSILTLRYRTIKSAQVQAKGSGHHTLMKPMEGDKDETVAETPPGRRGKS
jgi:hypothetical protein